MSKGDQIKSTRQTFQRSLPFERNLTHIWSRYRFLNWAYFVDFSVTFKWIQIDCVYVGFSTTTTRTKNELHTTYRRFSQLL